MKGVFALLALCAVCLALDPNDIYPCAFQMMTYTHIMSGDVEIASSADAMYHDRDTLWRWDSEFSGIPGLFEEHLWSVIWRHDEGYSYHQNMRTGECWLNNNSTQMYKYPLEWIASKTDGIEWSEQEAVYNDQPVTQYIANAKSTRYKFTVNSNVFVLKTGEVVFANGTVHSSIVDVEFYVDINQFIFNSEVPSHLFVPDKKAKGNCKDASSVPPEDPDQSFSDKCYKPAHQSSAAGVVINPSLAALLASLLAAIVICFAL